MTITTTFKMAAEKQEQQQCEPDLLSHQVELFWKVGATKAEIKEIKASEKHFRLFVNVFSGKLVCCDRN